MHRLVHNQSLSRIGLLATLFSAVFIVIFAILIIANEYKAFLDLTAEEEKHYFETQKQVIKQETERALGFIRYKYEKYKEMPEAELKKSIVDAIEYMRNERDGTGYIFIYTFDGINIADPILKQNAGKNMLDFTDPKGTKVIAELIEVSKHPDGGYVEYVWNKPIINRLAPKISYAASFKPWGWMVGTGVYLDSIEAAIEEKKAQYRERITHFMIQVAAVGMILLFLVLVFSRFIHAIIHKELDLFRHFFEKAATEYRPIKKKELSFVEFRTLSDHANSMVATIQEKTRALEEMNATLEEKVEEKTRLLQEQNEALLKANTANEKLIKDQDIFIKNTIHEVNTPLAIILTNIDLARIKHAANHYMVNIESAAKVIANLYNDLSYFIKRDRMEYPKENLDFSMILHERIDFFLDVARGNELGVIRMIAPDAGIHINRTKLERIIDNVLSNAIKYSYPQTEITVQLHPEPSGLRFSIMNHGDPIHEPEKIFERFYRENDNRGGFGIGLNMVRDICQENRITVTVTSESGINGFHFLFPVERSAT